MLVDTLIDGADLKVVQYCAEEVDRQLAGASSVTHMYRAWKYACLLRQGEMPMEIHAIQLNGLVLNTQVHGYRKTPVTFANGNHGVNASSVPQAMARLFSFDHLDVDEFVQEFLIIHPFSDGNGRVASLIHNLMSGTLETPHPLPYYNW